MSPTNVARKPDILTKVKNKQTNLTPYLTTHININSKWIPILNIKAKTIKLLEENSSKSSWPWICQWFLTYDTTCISKKGKIDKLD